MKLYILRHAEAEEKHDPAADPVRRLTSRGKSRMRDAAAGMRRFGLSFDTLLTSPFARAVQTATIVAEAYDGKLKPRELSALAGGVDPRDALKALTTFADSPRLMIVGHEPQLGKLASLLVAGSPDALQVDLKKAGCIAIAIESWLAAGRGKLLWMMTPRQLRKLR